MTMPLAAVVVAAFEIGQSAHARGILVGAWSVQAPATQPGAAQGAPNRAVPRLRITASKQPLAVLRSFAGEKQPEGTALYSVAVCSVTSSDLSVDPRQIEQALEARGIAVTTRALALMAVKRSRSRGLSILAKVGEVAGYVAPVIVGFAASGNIQLTPWQVAGVSAIGSGFRIIGDATKGEREAVSAGIDGVGPWISDSPTFLLGAGACSPRFLLLGSYKGGQPNALEIEQ